MYVFVVLDSSMHDKASLFIMQFIKCTFHTNIHSNWYANVHKRFIGIKNSTKIEMKIEKVIINKLFRKNI